MARLLTVILVAGAICAMSPAMMRAQRPAGDGASFAAYVSTDYVVTSNLTYHTASGMELKLDFYRPRNASTPLPTALFFHGGGWRVGAKKEGSALAVLPYLQMGWNAVNIEYRPSGVALAPAAVEDARCALRWVVQNATQYNVDTDRIIVTGQSAGAHLALMAGLVSESEGFDRNCPGTQPIKVAAIVSWYGIYDFTTLFEDPERDYAISWIGTQMNRKDIAARVSPMTYVRPGAPPTIAIHGDADPRVPYEQEVRAINELKKAGVAAELVTIPGGGHGNFERDQVLRAWAAVEAFLVRHGVTKRGSISTNSR